ncbi:MAG: protein-glutamate O-methyltransferase CheR [Myxococcota bacterium]
MQSITPHDFEFIRELLYKRSAMALGDNKGYLVEARLGELIHGGQCKSLPELMKKLRSRSDRRLEDQVVEAMTINETWFYRDLHPFEALRTTILPDIIAQRSDTRRLNIWCAASSTGQEPYSLAMLLHRHFPDVAHNWKVSFVATDISTHALNAARQGLYGRHEIARGLPDDMQARYFSPAADGRWQIDKSIRDMVRFDQLNLAAPWPLLDRMDLVMIRNVLIYFDLDTKRDIFRRLRQLMQPWGYMMLGAAETTMYIDDQFKRQSIHKCNCYRVSS